MKIRFDAYLLRSLHGFNRFLHALAHSLGKNDLAHGFLQALGSLFIVRTFSSLIAAYINYVQTGVFHVAVFIEVAMIMLLRQLIVEPVNVAAGTRDMESIFNASHYGLLLSALLVT